MHYVGEPNRYGLPAFYELHVWGLGEQSQGRVRGLERSRDLREAARGAPVHLALGE